RRHRSTLERSIRRAVKLAVDGSPDSSLGVRAAEMGAAIGCSLVGDFPRGTETAEPPTGQPEQWSPSSRFFRHWHNPCRISAPLCTSVTSTRERLPRQVFHQCRLTYRITPEVGGWEVMKRYVERGPRISIVTGS